MESNSDETAKSRKSRPGVLGLFNSTLPKYAYDRTVLQETTHWLRRRPKKRPNPSKFTLKELDTSQSEWTLLFLADAYNPNSVRFRPTLVDFLQMHAKEECQCVCITNHPEEEFVCHGTGFYCLPWQHPNRAGIFQLCGVSQVPSIIVVNNKTGRRVTDLGMLAIEYNGTRPKELFERWRRGESGLTTVQSISSTCCVS